MNVFGDELFERTPVSLAVVDGQGRVCRMNGRLRAVSGFESHEAVGRPFTDFIHPEDRAAAWEQFQALTVGTTTRIEGERRYRHKRGHTLWVFERVIPVELGGERLYLATLLDLVGRAGEMRYRAIFETSLDGILVVDSEGLCVEANPTFCDMLGVTREGIVGTPFTGFVARERRAEAEEGFRRLRTAGSASGEFPLVRRDGATIVVDWRWRADVLHGLHLCVARDVTDRHGLERAERVLSEITSVLFSSLDSRHALRSLASLSVPALADFCVVDMVAEEGRVERLATAHRDPAVVAERVEWARRWPVRLTDAEGAGRVIRSGQPVLYATVDDELLARTCPDPEQFAAYRGIAMRSMVVVPLAARGRVMGAITLVMSESGRRYGQRDLATAVELAQRAAIALDNARLYEDAQHANRVKDEFLATLSHELRTPLNAILGWARMLRNPKVASERLEHGLTVIERNASMQAQLVEDLLDVSRIDSGRLRLEWSDIDLATVVADAVDGVRGTAEAKGVRLVSNIARGTCFVLGDPIRLQQVAWNLLSNGVKFTPRGGEVRVVVRCDDAEAELVVADTGIGIDASVLPHVFERFRQGDSSTSRTFGGLGLGLSIVRHVVELHGGTVVARSEGHDRGSTFIVRLPLRPGAAERTRPIAAGTVATVDPREPAD